MDTTKSLRYSNLSNVTVYFNWDLFSILLCNFSFKLKQNLKTDMDRFHLHRPISKLMIVLIIIWYYLTFAVDVISLQFYAQTGEWQTKYDTTYLMSTVPFCVRCPYRLAEYERCQQDEFRQRVLPRTIPTTVGSNLSLRCRICDPSIPYKIGSGGSMPDSSAAECGRDHSPPSNTDIKNSWSFTSTLRHVSIGFEVGLGKVLV
jgi:hypothetical protein